MIRKRTELLAELKNRGYALFQSDTNGDDGASVKEVDSDDEASVSEDNMLDVNLSKGYEYLLGMKIWSLTFERAEELHMQQDEKVKEVESLDATPPEQIWLADLDAIEELLDERDKALGVDPIKQKFIQAMIKSTAPKKHGRMGTEKLVDEVSANRECLTSNLVTMPYPQPFPFDLAVEF